MDIRAEVGLINRNIVIQGLDNQWKGQILVSDYNDYSTLSGVPALRTGKIFLSNVWVKNCG